MKEFCAGVVLGLFIAVCIVENGLKTANPPLGGAARKVSSAPGTNRVARSRAKHREPGVVLGCIKGDQVALPAVDLDGGRRCRRA